MQPKMLDSDPESMKQNPKHGVSIELTKKELIDLAPRSQHIKKILFLANMLYGLPILLTGTGNSRNVIKQL